MFKSIFSLAFLLINLISYCQSGTLDNTFNYTGKVTTKIGTYATIFDMAIQQDRKIVVVGASYHEGYQDVTLARYNVDGSLDQTFGNNGIVITPVGTNADVGVSIALRSNGKILIGGYAADIEGLVDYYYVVAQYNINGTLDPSFGENGIARTIFEGNVAIGHSLAALQNGKILLAGGKFNRNHPADSDFTLLRYNKDGTLDFSFGNNGIVTTDIQNGSNDVAHSLKVQSDGKIVMAGPSSINTGYPYYKFTVTRYTSEGQLDQSFGNQGILQTDIGNATSFDLEIQSDNKIILAGIKSVLPFPNYYDIALVRYNSDGTLDKSFNSDGIQTLDIYNGSDDYAFDVTLQCDGKILVAGHIVKEGNDDFLLVRLQNNGDLDKSFNNSGFVITDFDQKIDQGNTIKASGSRIYVAGVASIDNDNNEAYFGIAAYKADDLNIISTIQTDKTILWPVNHQLVDIFVDYNNAGSCAMTDCELSITSNESENTNGDGNTVPDWQIVDNNHVKLRAERSGSGDGRIYIITAKCKDVAGNWVSKSTSVTVPKNNPKEVVNQTYNSSVLKLNATPNPSTSYFRVTVNSTNKKEKISLKVSNAIGYLTEVRTINADQDVIIGSLYQPGIYYLEAFQGTERVTFKLVKENR